MVRFLELSLARAGADQLITPREMLRDYMTVLNILMQNENVSFEQIISKVTDSNEYQRLEEINTQTEAKQTSKEYSATDIEF